MCLAIFLNLGTGSPDILGGDLPNVVKLLLVSKGELDLFLWSLTDLVPECTMILEIPPQVLVAKP